MTREYLNIGPTPYDESCLQVGGMSSPNQRRTESKVFANQIERYYPVPEECSVVVKSFQHDFGNYHEVCVVYDCEDSDQSQWAYSVEADTKDKLAEWDKESIETLKQLVADGQLPSFYFEDTE